MYIYTLSSRGCKYHVRVLSTKVVTVDGNKSIKQKADGIMTRYLLNNENKTSQWRHIETENENKTTSLLDFQCLSDSLLLLRPRVTACLLCDTLQMTANTEKRTNHIYYRLVRNIALLYATKLRHIKRIWSFNFLSYLWKNIRIFIIKALPAATQKMHSASGCANAKTV